MTRMGNEGASYAARRMASAAQTDTFLVTDWTVVSGRTYVDLVHPWDMRTALDVCVISGDSPRRLKTSGAKEVLTKFGNGKFFECTQAVVITRPGTDDYYCIGFIEALDASRNTGKSQKPGNAPKPGKGQKKSKGGLRVALFYFILHLP